MADQEQAPSAPTRPVVVPRPESSATLLGTGLVLLIVGQVLMQVGMDSLSGVLGLLAVAVGVISLASGIYRAARNLDSIAAASYNESLRRDG
ncbi:hypothetical protein M1843_12550 [Isoptericola sp. 4D.3]|uniref:Uncharacterized protein n=1 Tax=Isoptericola peretonis TaxID=2918523 RepID=A0ABT0J521_9MICO|nr:hypothetical protein [Isoptericola sp. 4D.3]